MKKLKINERFNILNNMELKESIDNKFINSDDLLTLESQLNYGEYGLVVAPAGSGKTTSVLGIAENAHITKAKNIKKTQEMIKEINSKEAPLPDASKEEMDAYFDRIEFEMFKVNKIKHETLRRIFLVPTTAIRDQLKDKLSNYDDKTFSYVIDGTFDEDKYDKASLIISVYDSIYKISDKINKEDIFYIDEAHEFISYRSMNEKKKLALQTTDLLQNKKIFITATPYNLADIFSKKIYYKADLNKKITMIGNNKGRKTATLLNQLSKRKGERHLIFVNNTNSISEIKELLNEEFPELTVERMSSIDKDNKALYNKVLTNALDVDVLLTTKFLNVGVDFQGQFDTIHYFEKTDANFFLQFLNRERQESNVIIYKNLREDGYKAIKNLNTKFTVRGIDNRAGLSIDELALMNKRLNLKGNDDVFMQVDELYNRQVLTTTDIKDLLELFYNNAEDRLEIIEENEIDKKGYNLNSSKTIAKRLKQLEENNVTTSDLYNAHIYGNLAQFLMDNESYSSSLLSKLKLVFDKVESEDVDKININSVINVTDNSNRNRIKNDTLKGIVDSIEWSLIDGITPEERDSYIETLNKNKFYIDEKEWTVNNFRTNLERFDIYTGRKNIRNKDTKKVFKILTNETILVKNNNKYEANYDTHVANELDNLDALFI